VVTVEVLVLVRKGSGGFAAATAAVPGATEAICTGAHFFATSGAEVEVLFVGFAVSSSGRRAIIRERIVGSIKSDSLRNSSSCNRRDWASVLCPSRA